MTSWQCCICLCDGSDALETQWASLACGHMYHYDCVKAALNTNDRCPNCRKLHVKKTLTKLFIPLAEQDPLDAGNDEQDVPLDSDEFLQLQRRWKQTISQKDLQIQNLRSEIMELEEKKNTLDLKVMVQQQEKVELDRQLQRARRDLTEANNQKKALENKLKNETVARKKAEDDACRYKRAYDAIQIVDNVNLQGNDLKRRILAATPDGNFPGGMTADQWTEVLSDRHKRLQQANKRAEDSSKLRYQIQAEYEEFQRKSEGQIGQLTEKIDQLESILASNMTTNNNKPAVHIVGSELNFSQLYSHQQTLAQQPARKRVGPILSSKLGPKRPCGVEQQQQQNTAGITPKTAVAASRKPMPQPPSITNTNNGTTTVTTTSDNGYVDLLYDSEDEGGLLTKLPGTETQELEIEEEYLEIESDDDDVDVDIPLSRPPLSPRKLNISNNNNSTLVDPKKRAVLLNAGPSKMGGSVAPGSSFIKDQTAANTGVSNGMYVYKGPDGRGGTTTVYKVNGNIISGAGRKQVGKGGPVKKGKRAKAADAANSKNIAAFFGTVDV